MESVAEVYLLSAEFMQDYPVSEYPELMHKLGRPYACLLIQTHNDYFICVPFRSSISHKNAFLFKNTKRSMKSRSGLDYSKMVLIKDNKYISSLQATVDQDEYNELRNHLSKIVNQVHAYVDTYMNHVTGIKLLHPREYDRKYRHSTLVYFHDILGIKDSNS